MNKACVMVLLFAPGLVTAATLYEWKEANGETHYGYRPPPGVIGTVVGEKLRQTTPTCKELQEEHLRLIDQEIARLRKLPVGAGFEFTAETRQRFINDLLVQRAALITGRAPESFAPSQPRQVNELNERYQRDRAKLVEDLEAQARQLQRERQAFEQQRREQEIILQRYRTLNPGLPY
jgi:hypothetical protein